jgi:uncharacterized protein YyaL (SSP411 family)
VLAFLQLRVSTSSTGEDGPTNSTDEKVMLDATCTAMARGGLYDQLGGGFARYSVDRGWVVPHFEKMLYDNAQLLGVYARWAGPLGERVARETADFLLAELGTREGGFAASLDADSDGVEGRFYVWTPEQLRDVLGADADWAADLFAVTEAGTFENGASTLQLPNGSTDVARWDTVRRSLLAARATRARPGRDDKVVAAWNGLAVASLAQTGSLLDESRLVAAAEAAGRLLVDVHLADGRLRRVSRDGLAGTAAGVLEDYGCVAEGFLALLQATGDPSWLRQAGVVLDTALDLFGTDDGGFYDTAADAESLVARPRDPTDNASPSGLSSVCNALLGYAAVTGSGRHRSAAEAALVSVRSLAERAPRFAGWSLAAAEAALDGPVEVAVIEGPGGDELASVARSSTRPGAVVVVGSAGDDVPLLEGRGQVDGLAAAYVCRNLVCERPVTSPDELRVLLSAASTSPARSPRSGQGTPSP